VPLKPQQLHFNNIGGYSKELFSQLLRLEWNTAYSAKTTAAEVRLAGGRIMNRPKGDTKYLAWAT
jgi:hypothetical protein